MIELMSLLVNALSAGAAYIVVALGMILVFGVLRIVNFAHGTFVVVGGFVGGLAASHGAPLGIAVAASVGTSALSALLSAVLVFIPLRKYPEEILFLASFGLGLGIQGLLLVVLGEAPRVAISVPGLSTVHDVAGVNVPNSMLFNLVAAIVVLFALHILLHRSRVGMMMRATAENQDMATLMGVSPRTMWMLAFTIAGCLTGLASVVWFVRIGSVTARSDLELTLVSFIVLALGGVGREIGVVIGAFAYGLFEAATSHWLPSEWATYQQLLVFLLVMVLLVFKPGGFFARREVVSR